jgi:carbonic anhydrase
VSFGAAAARPATRWSYTGAEGPAHWAELAPQFDLCGSGTRQSPIDVSRGQLLVADWLQPLQLKLNPSKLQLANDGHTIQVNYQRGSTLTFDKTTYELRQLQFHTPSEHTIDGVGADMEVQLVFADATNHLAVMAVLVSAGAENPFLATFWHALPEHEGQVSREIMVNAADALPANRDYLTYEGSLTTPPCTEGVTWILLKQRIEASPEQVSRFRSLFDGPAARPVQQNAERLIKDETAAPGVASRTS